MRRAVIILAFVAAVTCLCGAAQAANTWNYMLEGSVIPGPWYFQTQTDTSFVESAVIDAGTYNRAIAIVDNNTTVKGQILRPNYRSATGGVTVYTRFYVSAGATAGAVGLQIPDNYDPNGNDRGHVKWAWTSGQMIVTKGTPNGASSFSCPADTWVEVWLTVSNGQYRLWVKSGSTWTLTNQGAVRGGGVAAYVGSGDNAGTGTMTVDFLRVSMAGAYEPTDPNAPTLPGPTTGIGASKVNYPIGYPVDFPNKIVTNSWVETADTGKLYNVFFIQDDDRSAGIKFRRAIQSASEAVPLGARVGIKGYLDVRLKEAYGVPDGLTVVTPAPPTPVLPVPAGTVGRNVGAGKLGVQEAPMTTSYGLSNAGLRVRTSGVVTAVASGPDMATGFSMCYVDDGSGVVNDSLYTVLFAEHAYAGIKVYNAPGLNVGDKVEVTGSAGIEQYVLDNTIYYPVIYCALESDARVY